MSNQNLIACEKCQVGLRDVDDNCVICGCGPIAKIERLPKNEKECGEALMRLIWSSSNHGKQDA